MDKNTAKHYFYKAVHSLLGKLFDRDKLRAGQEVEVTATVKGRAGGFSFTEELDAVVKVGADSTRAKRTAVDPDELLGYFLAKLDDPDAVVRRLVTHFNKTKAMPKTADKQKNLAKSLREQLSGSVTEKKRGDVSVTPKGS